MIPTITLDQQSAQSRLQRYFDQFQTKELNGISIQLLPSRKDIPFVQKIAYLPAEDIFEVIFDNKSITKKSENDGIVFLEDADNRLVGIQILKPKEKGIQQIEFQVMLDLDNVIEAAKVNVGTDPKLLTRLDIEERKVDFLKDIFQNDFDKLVSAAK